MNARIIKWMNNRIELVSYTIKIIRRKLGEMMADR
jgi:hypothetical protein